MIMLCNSVRAVFVGVLFTPPVGCLDESSNGLVHVDDDDEAVCRLARDPDEVVCRCRFLRDPL